MFCEDNCDNCDCDKCDFGVGKIIKTCKGKEIIRFSLARFVYFPNYSPFFLLQLEKSCKFAAKSLEKSCNSRR